jgi:acetyl-CoA/propionyl-CoA carboxylase, biotin carboxylase, biotin carboxyl carrier protein
MPTILGFHRVVMTDPAFAPDDPDTPFSVHTRWIETEWTGEVAPYPTPAEAGETVERERIVVEVGGRRVEVSLPAGLGGGGGRGSGGGSARTPPAYRSASGGAAAGGDALLAPMQGTIVKLAVSDGDVVEAGDLVVVLEAMKMEQPITAHQAGTVSQLSAEVGSVVAAGAPIATITPASGS